MKRSKSGAQKRKEAATARDAVAKLPKMTDFFKITEQSRPGTSTERDEENYSVQEKEDYDDQHQSDCEFPENVSCDLPANTQPSISKITESQFTPIPDDPCKWPESISDAQRCDIVKRGPHQLIMNFPYNNTTPRRRFSSNHYKRVLPNGESVSRSWLVYSGESDQVFCFCCKLFGKTLSPFCSGINTWEGFSKKLKDHENGISHQECCTQWMLLAEGIRNSSTIDKREMNIFFNERRFWRNVLERLIDIALFLSERNLAFRGSEEVLGSPHNGNFLGIFELLARRDPILKELQDRIKNKNTKDHYLSPTIQNELIELLATEVEKENLQQLKLAKYFSIIFDCTPDMSHHEQMSVILRYVLCNEEAAVVKETFFGYLRISDSTGKGLLDAFLEKATELQLELSDCRGQSYDNGATMKGKHSGVQARMLDINPKAVYVPCANHTLNLVVVDSANSSTEALTFFGVLTRLYVLFSSSAQRWEILKKHVELSIKSQSDTRWESRIKCIKPLRYNLKEVLLALKDLEAISIERKDGRAASETKSLIAHLSKWSFLLSVFIWYDILFQVNKASKILQSYGVSLHTMETEIQATEKFLQNYRTTGYDSAATSAVEIAQELDPSFPPSRSGKKRRLFDYQGEEEQRATPELKFKSNFFYPLVDQAIMSIKERFNLLREVSSAFSFLYTRDKLLLVQQENALLTCCKEFQKKFGDIDSDEMSAELQRFVLILQKKRNLNTAQDFLNYLLKTHLFQLYPNVYIALRILLTCPVTVASAERSFSKLKLIKTFNRTSMTDSRLSSLAMLSIENDCARSLDYDNVIRAFANKKVRSRLFK